MSPGLVCAHHHLYSGLARGMPAPPATPHSFLQVLEQVWWRLDRALDLEMLEWSAKLAAVEALQAGTTAIIDHHESPNAIEGSLTTIADAALRSASASRAPTASPTATAPTELPADSPRTTGFSPRAGAAWSASTPRSPAPTTHSLRQQNSR
ncbi:MAG: amidohydrolase family protein [Ilumatobacteraceae bacterium]